MLLGALAVVAFLADRSASSAQGSAAQLAVPPAPNKGEPREPTAFEEILQVNEGLLSEGGADGAELTQGDIVVTDMVRKMFNLGRVKRGAHADKEVLWPKNAAGQAVIPYVIESSAAGIASQIMAGIRHWTQNVPCLRFIARTSERDYVSFFRGSGCYSFIGRTGRRQQISLGAGCERLRTVVHEIGHALGFWHEQSRPDRDNFVTIHWENIPEGSIRRNFRKRTTDDINSLGEPYDYNSVMHYSSKAFGINRAVTITRKGGSQDLGNRVGLSPLDIRQAKKLYCTAPSCALTDNFQWCGIWKERGYCNGRYSSFVRPNCQKSCLLRPDNSPSCGYWKQRGYCTGSVYSAFMRKNCQTSCNCT